MLIKEQILSERKSQYHKAPAHVPSVRCFHPLFIYNRVLNDKVLVNCRKCPACRYQYSVEIQQRLTKVCEKFPYVLFVTLTYDNAHMPIFLRISDHEFAHTRTGEIIDARTIDNFSYMRPRVKDPVTKEIKESMIDGFGVPYVPDIQGFIKRLRSRVARHFKNIYPSENEESKENKKLRYFFCAEYCPTSLRPHYHGLLFIRRKDVAEYVYKNVVSAWSFASLADGCVSYVRNNAASYVSKYVNGFDSLPSVLQTKSARPFHLASKDLGKIAFSFDRKTLEKIFFDGNIETLNVIDKDNRFAYVPYSYKAISRLFPKCQGFSIKSDLYKLWLFKKYRFSKYKKFRVNQFGEKELNRSVSMVFDNRCFSEQYDYEDDRFAKMCQYWCDYFNVTPEFYIQRLNHIYSSYKLLQLRSFYEFQEQNNSLDSKQRGLENLSCYDYLWRLLPRKMSSDEWRFTSPTEELIDDIGKPFFGTSYMALFGQFGLLYSDLYDEVGDIKLSLSDCFSNEQFVIDFRNDVTSKAQKYHKIKKINEHQFHFIDN